MKRPLPGVVAVLSLLERMFLVPRWQAQNRTRTIRSLAQDVTGAQMPSVCIVLRATSVSFECGTASDTLGGFRVEDLPPGTYDVIVAAQGFEVGRSRVTIQVSSVSDITVTMSANAGAPMATARRRPTFQRGP
jgi:spore coat protein U-like protein